MKKTVLGTKVDPVFALNILQRNLDRGYLDNPYGDDMYEAGYASCLKDIAYLLLGNDDNYGKKD